MSVEEPRTPGMRADGTLVLPVLDVLPAGCGIDMELDTSVGKVKFRAVDGDNHSGWSPVYDLGALPDRLSWADLWASARRG